MKETETCIKYYNKDKNFQEDIITFKGEDAYEQAIKWGQENLDNFNLDMIDYPNFY